MEVSPPVNHSLVAGRKHGLRSGAEFRALGPAVRTLLRASGLIVYEGNCLQINTDPVFKSHFQSQPLVFTLLQNKSAD